jgi:hypothetical protein
MSVLVPEMPLPSVDPSLTVNSEKETSQFFSQVSKLPSWGLDPTLSLTHLVLNNVSSLNPTACGLHISGRPPQAPSTSHPPPHLPMWRIRRHRCSPDQDAASQRRNVSPTRRTTLLPPWLQDATSTRPLPPNAVGHRFLASQHKNTQSMNHPLVRPLPHPLFPMPHFHHINTPFVMFPIHVCTDCFGKLKFGATQDKISIGSYNQVNRVNWAGLLSAAVP